MQQAYRTLAVLGSCQVVCRRQVQHSSHSQQQQQQVHLRYLALMLCCLVGLVQLLPKVQVQVQVQDSSQVLPPLWQAAGMHAQHLTCPTPLPKHMQPMLPQTHVCS
jgi:hypothetical protein